MTSNLGSEYLLSSDANASEKVQQMVRSHFRPEFLNRLDDIIVFDILKKDSIREVVKLQLDIVRKRLEAKDIHLEVDEKAIDFISDTGFDPQFGARPIKRLIQTEILNRVATALIGRKKESESTVFVTLGKDKKLSVEMKKTIKKSTLTTTPSKIAKKAKK